MINSTPSTPTVSSSSGLKENLEKFTKKDINQLLSEYYKLSARKPRSDIGKPRPLYPTTRKPRSDVFSIRNSYNCSAAVLKRQFDQALASTALRNSDGEIVGEGASRDENGLFDLRVNKHWRAIKVGDFSRQHIYKTKIASTKRLEEYRWQWIKAMINEAPPEEKDDLIKLFCNKYFVKPAELADWTFSEWANAYMSVIRGWKNTDEHNKTITILSYWDENNKPIIYQNNNS